MNCIDTIQLTSTRFIAAILIVIYHFGNQVFPFNIFPFSIIIQNAYLGVSYFFLLSGFVMTIAYGRKEEPIIYSLFFQKRAARILPLYYLALLLMVIYFFVRIHLFNMHSKYQPSVHDFLQNVFLIQAWIPDESRNMNTAAWTLSVEAFFYLVFPFFYNFLYKRFRLLIISIVIIAFFACSQFLLHILVGSYPKLTGYYLTNPLFHLNQFLLGNLIGLFFIRLRQPNPKLILAIFLVAIAAFIIIKDLFIHVIYSNGIFLMIFIPLLLLIVYDKSKVLNFFRNKTMVFLGEISYGVYILQFPVYFFFTAFLTVIGYKINQPMFYAYLLILTAVSALSYNYIEKPLRGKIGSIRFFSNRTI